MRTTLNIDDEILRAAREIARQTNLPTGTAAMTWRYCVGPT